MEWRVRKSRPDTRSLFSFVGEGPFLWFVSFGPAKEMNSRVSAKGFDLVLFFTEQKSKAFA
jgi:hypothetical protein